MILHWAEFCLRQSEIGLTGLWLDGQKYFGGHLPAERRTQETPILTETRCWLDIYFTSREPDFLPPLHPVGSVFRQAVSKSTSTDSIREDHDIRRDCTSELPARQGLERMSAQAVGGAVGHNEISIIIPCHPVVGTNGSLTGYAGRIDKKIKAAGTGTYRHEPLLRAKERHGA